MESITTAKATTWDLQRTYNWEFILPDIVSGDGSSVSPFIQEVKFGEYNFSDIVSIRQGAFKSHTAGFLDIGTLNMTILSPTNLLVVNYFQAWKNLLVSNDGFYGYKESYAKIGILFVLDRKQNNRATYKFINMFPKTFPSYGLSYADEGVVKFNIEFQYDRLLKS
jgi:hypothetical protein